MMRYSYLRGPGGRFRNPYDHGCKKNCSDFLITGYNEDEEYAEAPTEAEGLSMVQMTRSANHMNGGNHSLHQSNRNSHVVIDVNQTTNSHKEHIHSSHCSHSSSSSSTPLGLGIGLGRNVARSAVVS